MKIFGNYIKKEQETPYQSNINGLPYLPKYEDIPLSINKLPMRCFLQINFEEIPLNYYDFKKIFTNYTEDELRNLEIYKYGNKYEYKPSGILQIWLAVDGFSKTLTNNYKIKYYPSYDLDNVDYLISKDYYESKINHIDSYVYQKIIAKTKYINPYHIFSEKVKKIYEEIKKKSPPYDEIENYYIKRFEAELNLFHSLELKTEEEYINYHLGEEIYNQYRNLIDDFKHLRFYPIENDESYLIEFTTKHQKETIIYLDGTKNKNDDSLADIFNTQILSIDNSHIINKTLKLYMNNNYIINNWRNHELNFEHCYLNIINQ